VRKITNDQANWLAKKKPRWEEYRKVHSREALKRAFSKLLDFSLI
jgi:hypothetical protein